MTAAAPPPKRNDVERGKAAPKPLTPEQLEWLKDGCIRRPDPSARFRYTIEEADEDIAAADWCADKLAEHD